MSRSRKKHPFLAWCSGRNKPWKQLANRIFRRKSKININQGKEPKHDLNEISDTWSWPSDGLATYRKNLDKKYLRK